MRVQLDDLIASQLTVVMYLALKVAVGVPGQVLVLKRGQVVNGFIDRHRQLAGRLC